VLSSETLRDDGNLRDTDLVSLSADDQQRMIRLLLDAGADPADEVPGYGLSPVDLLLPERHQAKQMLAVRQRR